MVFDSEGALLAVCYLEEELDLEYDVEGVEWCESLVGGGGVSGWRIIICRKEEEEESKVGARNLPVSATRDRFKEERKNVLA